jgi:outer membrane protein
MNAETTAMRPLIPWIALLALLGPREAVLAQQGPRRLTLQECIQTALANHPDLVAARAQVQAAQQRVLEARSNYRPRVDLQLSYTRQTYNFAASPGTSPHQVSLFSAPQSSATAGYYYAGITAGQTLYDFGNRRGTMAYSQAELAAAEHNLERVRQSVVYEVRRAYFSLLAAEQELEARRQALANQEKHLEQVRAFYSVGRRPRIDVTTQEVAVTQARVHLREAEETVRVARAALATAMGLPIEQAPEPADSPNTLESFGSLETLLAEAEQNRPDVQALRQQVEAARAVVLIARSALKPSFSLSALLNYRNLKFPLVYNWGLAGLVTQSLFSGGYNQARVAEAEAQQKAAEAQLESLLLRVRQEVFADFSDLTVARDRIALSDQALGEARENLTLAEGRYQNGYGNIIELNDAQLLLTESQVNAIVARLQYHLAAAALEIALGRRQ